MIIGPRLVLSWSPLAFLEKMENAVNANLSVGCNHFSIVILSTTVLISKLREMRREIALPTVCVTRTIFFYIFSLRRVS